MEIDKGKLINHLRSTIENQLDLLGNELQSIADEMSKETKSSAGDKFETSREMMNQERGRLEERLAHLKQQLIIISQFKTDHSSGEIQNGSLVRTENFYFLFGLAFGKLIMDNFSIMVLSLTSPIGKKFLEKKVGDRVEFNNTIYTVQSIC